MRKAGTIVLCEPDQQSARAICEYLSANGYRVTPVAEAGPLERLLEEPRGVDLVILDYGLKGADALAIARRLSEATSLGILMMTSSQDSLERICSLEAGADDCVSKPIELRELYARVKAILRRMRRREMAVRTHVADSDVVPFGPCTLDVANRALRKGDGRRIRLTEMEMSLIRIFLEHPNEALDRDAIAELAYGRTWSPFDRSLDIRISRLRRKIESDPARPAVITTVRGIGYRYEARSS